MGTTTITSAEEIAALEAAALAPIGNQPKQLSFFVGGSAPTISVIQLSGAPICETELAKGTEIHVQCINVETGEVVANGYGRVEALSFKDKRDEDDNVVETRRTHHAKVS